MLVRWLCGSVVLGAVEFAFVHRRYWVACDIEVFALVDCLALLFVVSAHDDFAVCEVESLSVRVLCHCWGCVVCECWYVLVTSNWRGYRKVVLGVEFTAASPADLLNVVVPVDSWLRFDWCCACAFHRVRVPRRISGILSGCCRCEAILRLGMGCCIDTLCLC